MKKIILLTCVYFSFIYSVFCQNALIQPENYLAEVYVYSSKLIDIELNTVENKFVFVRKHQYNDITMSSGKIVINGNVINCIKHNKILLGLKKMDKYRLIITKKNLYFNNNEILYLTEILGPKGVIETMNWKDGKRDGWWAVLSMDGIKSVLYKNGAIKQTRFESWKEIHSKPAKL